MDNSEDKIIYRVNWTRCNIEDSSEDDLCELSFSGHFFSNLWKNQILFFNQVIQLILNTIFSVDNVKVLAFTSLFRCFLSQQSKSEESCVNSKWM